jgi:hypothetical protein
MVQRAVGLQSRDASDDHAVFLSEVRHDQQGAPYICFYDKLKENKEPSALSSTGIMKAVRDLGGPDLQQIQGYRGASEFAEAAAPAVATTALGLPGLFPRTALGLTGEGAVAGSTGLLAESIAPDSPLAQFAIQATPYAIGGGVKAARNATGSESRSTLHLA